MTAKLRTHTNVPRPDELYALLVDMHEGLAADESAAASAKLILLLANHVGDLDVVREAVAIARGGAA